MRQLQHMDSQHMLRNYKLKIWHLNCIAKPYFHLPTMQPANIRTKYQFHPKSTQLNKQIWHTFHFRIINKHILTTQHQFSTTVSTGTQCYLIPQTEARKSKTNSEHTKIRVSEL